MFPSHTVEYRRKKRAENPEHYRERNRKWNTENPDKIQEMYQKYYTGVKTQRAEEYKNLVIKSVLNGDLTRWIVLFWLRACKERRLQKIRSRRYYKNNRDKMIESSLISQRKCRPKRYKEDIQFKLACSLRSRIRSALKGVTKSERTLRLLGCDLEQLKRHLESQWSPGMSWENWGYGDLCWHIDHKKACATFDLRSPTQQKQCFHFSNLQPLWQKDNLAKGIKCQP